MNILNRSFRYTSAVESTRPGYLREKFLAMNPRCFDKPVPKPRWDSACDRVVDQLVADCRMNWSRRT